MQEAKRARMSVFQSRSFLIGTAVLVVLGLLEALVLRSNTPQSSSLFYVSDCLALTACAWGCLLYARSAAHSLRLRWLLLSVGLVCATTGYLIAFLQSLWPGDHPARIFQISCFTASEAMYLLAVVLFFSNAGRSVVFVDMLQALLFVVLRFNLSYNYTTHDYSDGHLQIGLLVALFLFLVAVIACVGAVTQAEQKFLYTMSWLFGVRYVAFFLSNQVSFLWLGFMNSSAFDAVGSTLLGLCALYLFTGTRAAHAASSDASHRRRRSVMVRNLMPSFLAFVNLMLGLFTLEATKPLGYAALALTVIFYVARTTLLQNQTSAEQAVLQSRNDHLESLATRDPLTGVGNRRSFALTFERLQEAREPGVLTLMLMDIDYFKAANDRFGHLHGDKVLIALGQTLKRFAEQVPNGHCARLGGDEFALLLPGVPAKRASALAEELRTSFASHRFEATDTVTTLSVGIAVLAGKDCIALDSLVAAADAALYEAKLQGRNRVAAA